MPRRKTDAEFRKEVFERYHGKLTPLQMYRGSNHKIRVKCNVCNYIWRIAPSHLLDKHNHGCPKCYHQRQFLHKLHKVHGNNITPLQMYRGSNRKIWVKCNKCGHKWKTTPANLFRGRGCPKCAAKQRNANRKLSNTEFVRRVHNLYGNNITPLQKYINLQTKIWIKCNRCGYKWKSRPANLLNGMGCPKCGKRYAAKEERLPNSKFIEKLHKIRGDRIIPLQKYRGMSHKIWFACRKCGYKWKTTPANVLRVKGTGCPKCTLRCEGRKRRLSNSEFLKRIHKLYNNTIEPLQRYRGGDAKIWVKCKRCGYKWKTPAKALMEGYGCRVCTSKQKSHGEYYICNWLKNHSSEKFIYGYVIKSNGLHLDFWVPSYRLAIEFDGIQHFRYVPYFCNHDPKQFKKEIKRDQHKNSYCINHHITLIRIQDFHNNTYYKHLHPIINHILSCVFFAYCHHRLHTHIYRFNTNNHGRLLHNLKKNA